MVEVYCTCFADALDDPNNKSTERPRQEDFFATSLGYLAEQFESHAVNITRRLQQLDYSSDDFVSIIFVPIMATNAHDSKCNSSSCLLEQEREKEVSFSHSRGQGKERPWDKVAKHN